MRVVFCDNVLVNHARPDAPYDLQPHLGLLSLLAIAVADGHDGAIFDPAVALHRGTVDLGPSFYADVAASLLDLDPDVLGLTSLGCNLICTYKIARHVKRARPELPILLGGPHATILSREVLAQFAPFDVVVRHEAEGNLSALLRALDGAGSLEDVPGLTFRRGGRVVSTPPTPLIEDLDQLPWPAYDRYPIEDLGLRSMRVEAGRGCPFSCTFCSTASFFGRRYRLKSPDRLVAELDFLNSRYGICDFALTHDMFTANKNKVTLFCEAVAGRGYTWSCSARMDCVDPQLLATMYDSGCRAIYYGVETGSARMQKISDKHMDLGLVEPVLDTTGRVGMSAVVSMITGFPEETADDQAATLDMLGDCMRRSPDLVSLQLHLLTPEPGTLLYDQRRGSLAYDGHITDFNFPTLEPDDAEVMRALPELFMTHHYYETELPRERHVFVERAFLLLSELGFHLVRRMARDVGGRLSALVDAMHACLGDDADELCPDAVVEFARRTWGPDDPVTSAVRYVTLANALRSSALRPPPAEQWSGYRVGRTAALLTDIHAVQPLLAALADDPRALDRDRAGTANRTLVLFVEPARPNEVRCFETEGVVALLLDWLDRPRSERAVEDWAHQFGANAPVVGDLVRRLCELGVVSRSDTLVGS